MSGQCGAGRTPVILYRATSKYGTAEDRHTRSRLNDSARRCIYTTGGRRGGGGDTAGLGERVHLFPSGHVATELERSEGEKCRGTSQTENTAAAAAGPARRILGCLAVSWREVTKRRDVSVSRCRAGL